MIKNWISFNESVNHDLNHVNDIIYGIRDIVSYYCDDEEHTIKLHVSVHKENHNIYGYAFSLNVGSEISDSEFRLIYSTPNSKYLHPSLRSDFSISDLLRILLNMSDINITNIIIDIKNRFKESDDVTLSNIYKRINSEFGDSMFKKVRLPSRIEYRILISQ